MSGALRMVLLLGFGFGLLGCADSHDKLMKDQMAYIEELTVLMKKVAEGSISSAEGAERINKWGDRGGGVSRAKGESE